MQKSYERDSWDLLTFDNKIVPRPSTLPTSGYGRIAESLAEMLPGIGIFGTGSVVRIIVPFLRSKGFVVEALWGRTLPAAQQAAKELGIPFCTTKVDEVLLRKDVDLIFVLCSPHLHAQISVKALGIGKHVLCDRPAGICQNDALKMVKASQYYPSLISIGKHKH